jgi:hypothetical protein
MKTSSGLLKADIRDEVSRETFAQIERFAGELPEELPGADIP